MTPTKLPICLAAVPGADSRGDCAARPLVTQFHPKETDA
jgi:hypothetical protein